MSWSSTFATALAMTLFVSSSSSLAQAEPKDWGDGPLMGRRFLADVPEKWREYCGRYAIVCPMCTRDGPRIVYDIETGKRVAALADMTGGCSTPEVGILSAT